MPVNPLLFPDSLLSPPSITLLYRKDQASIPSFSFSCLTNFTSLWCQKEVEPFSSARLPVPLQRGQCAAGTQCFPGRGEESALISKVGEFHMEQQLVSLCLFKTKHLFRKTVCPLVSSLSIRLQKKLALGVIKEHTGCYFRKPLGNLFLLMRTQIHLQYYEDAGEH